MDTRGLIAKSRGFARNFNPDTTKQRCVSFILQKIIKKNVVIGIEQESLPAVVAGGEVGILL